MSLPVWRELKLDSAFVDAELRACCLNEPSRLKGIETCRLAASATPLPMSLNEPSRLKGIETKPIFLTHHHTHRLNEPSRLKGIETVLGCRKVYAVGSLNEPSRLKGIETKFHACATVAAVCWSEWAFPFEGNWNSIRHSRDFIDTQSEWAFPFEGNWNSIYQSPRQQLLSKVWMSLPVWRELKHASGLSSLPFCAFWSEWAFPFEGNWNPYMGWSVFSLHPRLNEPSRLKGMETKEQVGMPAKVEFPSEWAFPFEGNWNSFPPIFCRLCRELVSEWAFPFEGNWNRRI